MDKRNEWMREFEFDSEAAYRIAAAVEKHNMTLRDAADILDTVAPMCDELTPRGAVDRIRSLTRSTLICKPPEKIEREKPPILYIMDEVDSYNTPGDKVKDNTKTASARGFGGTNDER